MKKLINLLCRKPKILREENSFISIAFAMSAWQCGGEDC